MLSQTNIDTIRYAMKSCLIVFFVFSQCVHAQKNLHSEQLHTAQPDYSTPYSLPKNEEIKATLDMGMDQRY